MRRLAVCGIDHEGFWGWTGSCPQKPRVSQSRSGHSRLRKAASLRRIGGRARNCGPGGRGFESPRSPSLKPRYSGVRLPIRSELSSAVVPIWYQVSANAPPEPTEESLAPARTAEEDVDALPALRWSQGCRPRVHHPRVIAPGQTEGFSSEGAPDGRSSVTATLAGTGTSPAERGVHASTQPGLALFSIVQREALARNEFDSLERLAARLLAFRRVLPPDRQAVRVDLHPR